MTSAQICVFYWQIQGDTSFGPTFFNFMKLLGKMSKMVVVGATHPVWEILDQALILFKINMLVLGR